MNSVLSLRNGKKSDISGVNPFKRSFKVRSELSLTKLRKHLRRRFETTIEAKDKSIHAWRMEKSSANSYTCKRSASNCESIMTVRTDNEGSIIEIQSVFPLSNFKPYFLLLLLIAVLGFYLSPLFCLFLVLIPIVFASSYSLREESRLLRDSLRIVATGELLESAISGDDDIVKRIESPSKKKAIIKAKREFNEKRRAKRMRKKKRKKRKNKS